MAEVVGVTLRLAPARPFEIEALARRLDEQPGELVSAARLERLLAHEPEDLDALLAWATRHGLARVDGDARRLRFAGTLAQLRQAFGDAGLRALASRRAGAPAIASVDALPPRLRGMVARIELSPGAPGPWGEALSLGDPPELEAPLRPARCGVTPAELERALSVPRDTDGAGQRIAMMALGGLPRARDLEVFAASFERPRARPSFIALGPVSPQTRDDPLFRHETTMSVQWIGALAPAAELRVYVIDPRHVADPWVAFFEAALADHATIATTAWSSPEQQYYASHGRQIAASLLDQLALRGCTVLAASGDWGPCAGAPRARIAGDSSLGCARPWPGVAFPCSEPRVLAVGGTMGLEQPELLRAELSRDLAERLGLREVSSGGGFSEQVAIPPWQAAALRSHYPRDAGAPAVLPSGRAVPDLALPAWAVPGLAGFGFCGLVDERWRDDIGGTSLSVALAAACLARVNQALEARGRPRMGCVGPRLYRTPGVLRPVERGTTSVELPCVDERGRLRWEVVPGFVATSGWDPGAGLGVPDFARLLERLEADWQ
ncbi:MAG: S53 family peptidase [Enhygromyxa sp.]